MKGCDCQNVTSKAFIRVFVIVLSHKTIILPFVWLKCSVGIKKIRLRVIETEKWNQVMTVSVGSPDQPLAELNINVPIWAVRQQCTFGKKV